MQHENHPFDERLRERLAELPPPSPVTGGWERLAEDLAVQEKLATLTPVPPANGWSVLEAKLTTAENAATAELDRIVATGLRQSEPTQTSGWPALASRLELVGQRRQMIGCMKVAEAALLLSMLLLFVRFGGPETVSPAPELPARPGTAFPIVATDPAPASAPVSPVAVTSVDFPAAAAVTASAPTPVPARTVATLPTIAPAALALPPTPLPRFPRTVDALAAADPALSLRSRIPSPALRLPALAARVPVHYYLDAFVSPMDINQVITPASPLYGIEGDNRLTYGRSFGTLLDITQGRSGLQIGLIYGRRSYIPTELYRVEQVPPDFIESTDAQYSRLTFNTLTLPLNYQRALLTTTEWRLSGRFGMAMNVIVKSEFLLGDGQDRATLEETLQRFVALNNTNGAGRATADGTTTANLLDPAPGYFQRGSLLENSSFYLNGGFTLERLIDERLSLYFSPSVSRAVFIRQGEGGKGPLEDRIHNATLRFGTRYRLSNK